MRLTKRFIRDLKYEGYKYWPQYHIWIKEVGHMRTYWTFNPITLEPKELDRGMHNLAKEFLNS